MARKEMNRLVIVDCLPRCVNCCGLRLISLQSRERRTAWVTLCEELEET